MTRAEFLARLRKGLDGLNPGAQAEIVSDYERHFDDGLAAGRTEDQVAAALGDPERLARELRAEQGMKRWESERSPTSAGAAIFALVGLGAIDIIILLPLLTGVVSALFGFLVAAVVVFFFGGGLLAIGPFFDPPGGPLFAVFAGLGLMGGAIFGGAVTTILSVWLVNGLVWFARLHYRLLKPALEAGQPVAEGARS